jgi:hypothetical protein
LVRKVRYAELMLPLLIDFMTSSFGGVPV